MAGFGLLGVALITMSSAHAQMAVTNDGLIFPDETVQTTAVIVENFPRIPFQTRLTFNITSGSTQNQISIPIPAGKRLITEHVSSRVQGPTGQQFFASINVVAFHNGVNFGIFFMVFTLQGTFSAIDLFTASQPMRVYADSTANNIFVVTRTSSVGSAFAEVDISGYLVDL